MTIDNLSVRRQNTSGSGTEHLGKLKPHPSGADRAYYVINRDGKSEEVRFDRITDRLIPLCVDLHPMVNPITVAKRVIEGLYPGVTTAELDSLAAETAAYMSQDHPDFSVLAARVAVSSLHKMTSDSFLGTVKDMYYSTMDKTGAQVKIVSKEILDMAKKYEDVIELNINYQHDYNYDYFGFKTLERSYLLKDPNTKATIERPQHMLMRVSLGIHGDDIDAAIRTYKHMSSGLFTHASPTLYNSGTPKPQMSSCFLLSMVDDSIEGIFETLKRCAAISKTAGGIGVAFSNIRALDSYIAGSNGFSNGIVPMLRVFNDTARYVDQGGGKRKGAFAMYLEPWHADVEAFLDLKKNHGKEEQRARDLFYALWVPDLFMRRVLANQEWTLFCPNEAPGLQDVHSEEFDQLYEQYEEEGRGRRTVKAQALWHKIIASQQETGVPYMLYKDACNKKSNQKNLGTIRCSNLCTEIVEYTSADEIAVCNLASLALNRYVVPREKRPDIPDGVDVATFFVDNLDKFYDFKKLYELTKVLTFNLNCIIDRNYYPLEEAKKSNMRNRPIGIGVQGLADAFLELRLPFESEPAKQLNVAIFETIYFAACERSMELAKEFGPYETFEGSPASEGKLQFDLWETMPHSVTSGSNRWDWDSLKGNIKLHGMRNSLLVAPMPTASTAQILGNNESFEPYTQNMYVRRVLSGEFVQVNRHLVKDLLERDLWNGEIKQQLISHRGSVQRIEAIPDDLKQLYKTVWEIKQKVILDMAAGRGPYIDQSQSLNVHMKDCTNAKLSSLHFYAWKLGLKTGQYYLRTQAAVEAIQFSVEAKSRNEDKDMRSTTPFKEDEGCISCSA